jgi:hypothetical protein
MKITRDNYESFFIDYIEGNLHESMIDQFLDFLNQNPDLKEELHLFEEVNLPEEHVVFQEKQQLHKSTADENRRLENTVVAYIEGDLDADENKAFETYLAGHPELKKEYDLFTKTLLAPDSGIKYPEKRKLYRKSGATIVMSWVARAAAVLVLVWGINSVIQTKNTQELGQRNPEVAEVSPKPVSTVKKADSEKIDQEKAVPVKNKPERANDIQEKTNVEPKETRPVDSDPTDRDLTALAQITPIVSQLDQESIEIQLAFSRSVNSMKINDSKNVMSVEEFLADRAKKVGKEGLFSVQRIARLGLNLASEISGERIGYKMKDGKIASVDFESKLMAFSIPLEKK